MCSTNIRSMVNLDWQCTWYLNVLAYYILKPYVENFSKIMPQKLHIVIRINCPLVLQIYPTKTGFVFILREGTLLIRLKTAKKYTMTEVMKPNYFLT